ncbi:hypothetical protein L596_019808 [Steinernema carpocapsae]|uniref:Uncharacterized protein n=1 Tax=Steinernema carpocapsae TaxID=34508 RepID=A0A4U5MRQ0_STECR|nr:hypothetical protein L596_019808 [Steinernema carpocapsae]
MEHFAICSPLQESVFIKAIKEAMETVPVEFIEEMLLTTQAEGVVFNRMALLSDPFGFTAVNFQSKCHDTVISLQSVRLYGQTHRIWQKPSFLGSTVSVMIPKYNITTFFNCCITGDRTPSFGEPLVRALELQENLELILGNPEIDDKWIRIFASLKNLRDIFILCFHNDNIFNLLQAVLEQGRLLALRIRHETDRDIELACKFLEQEQFLSLTLNIHRFENETSIGNLWTKNKKKLAGKRVNWMSYCKMHNVTFERVTRDIRYYLRYENSDCVVEYFNPNGTLAMKDAYFLEGVTWSTIYFKPSLEEGRIATEGNSSVIANPSRSQNRLVRGDDRRTECANVADERAPETRRFPLFNMMADLAMSCLLLMLVLGAVNIFQ